MKICAGNWKMNGTVESVEALAEKMNEQDFQETEIILAVPYTLIGEARKRFKRPYKIAAQRICPYAQKGAYTGEISGEQVKNAGGEVVIIGHSERAKYFEETNEQVRSQLERAVEAGLEVILCVGETEKEKEENKTLKVIRERLAVLKSIAEKSKVQITVAYEPIWAIGTGKIPSNEEIEEVVKSIAEETEGSIKGIIYGGSVNKDNADTLMRIRGLSGFLVGNTSLTEEFISICRSCK